ncbi:MAG: hypothetical protein JWQ87_980 [Candidatus Sulfotelmatobacter sp.]|nr:hypothetical protein [Candidatus Sulfotelmatobacter sp.]
MAIYYRATTTPMPVGKNPGEKTYDFSNDAERRRLEEFLEERRPGKSHSRLSSWFACDSPEHAARYLDAQLKHEEKRGDVLVFEVEMPAPSKQPMALIDALLAALREGDIDKAEFLVEEYWTPKQSWKFWEYTSGGISLVAAKIESVDEMAVYIAHQDYAGDRARIKRLLAERPKSPESTAGQK